MPLPHRLADESLDAFVARFMGSAEARAEFPDQDQRLAVALQKARERAKLEKTSTPKRRIKHATVRSLALCKRGKTGLATLFKSDGTAEWQTLVKGDMVRGELLAVAYPFNFPDEDGDFADTMGAIESMAHSFLRNGAQLDIEHDGGVLTPEQAFIKESFIIQPDDTRFKAWPGYDGKPVDVTGGWAVKVQLDDPDLRAAFARGEWDGVSLLGPAAVEQVDLKAASHRVAARMGGAENEMTKEELQAALAAQEAKIAELVKSSVAEAMRAANQKPAEVPAKPADQALAKPAIEAPTFTGDPLDPQALGEYERALRRFELQKSLSEGKLTADQLAEMRKSLTAKLPSTRELVDAGIPAKDEDSAEVRQLQVKLFNLQKASNAPERRGASSETYEEELAKAAHQEGLAIAQLANEFMGNAPSQGMRVLSKS